MMRFGVGLGLWLTAAAPVWAQSDAVDAPLSAINWLSESVEQPQTAAVAPVLGTQATRTPDANEDPVANSASTPDVSVQPLGGAAPRVLGVLSPAATGFSLGIWENSDAETLAALLMAEEIDTLPALQDLLTTLALTQANPPREGAATGSFFLARVDKLLAFGALEPAQALLEAATPDTGPLFQRWFDVSLLTGTEDAACASLQDKPDVAPTPAARVFCLARSGDWSAAALTLNTGVALGDIDADTGALLARFLDPELFEGEADLETPDRVTPLTFRMFEAIGAPLATANLPRAFSHADLRENVGWKGQLEAAERLARAGALADNRLIGLYTARVPAASGGVWDRARAVTAFNAALANGNNRGIDAAMLRLWREAQSIGVMVPLAQVYAPQLLASSADPTQRFKWLLLSDSYEDASMDPTIAQTDPFLAAVARGMPEDARADGIGYSLVRDAFGAEPDAALVTMAQDGRTGEAILRTIATVQQGIDGDPIAFQSGIATLRALGLEDVARRTSLQYLLLQ